MSIRLDRLIPDHTPTSELRVLDIGTGEGRTLALLERAGVVAIGVEIDPLLANLADKSMHGSHRVVQGSALDLPIHDGTIDVVCLLEVLEHLNDPQAALRECRRVTKPSGQICLAIPTAYTERLFWRIHPRYAANSTHLHIFTRDQIAMYLDTAGFIIDAWETSNLAPAVAWTIHCILRTDADHTGRVGRMRWLEPFVDRVLGCLYRIRGVRSMVGWLGARVGKSWYIYAYPKPAANLS